MTTKRSNLLLVIDDASDEPRYRQIYRQIADAIESGVLAETERLPSIRKLCDMLQVSHTTVEQAYLQLSVEGYVRTVPRSGYVVECLDIDAIQHAHRIRRSGKERMSKVDQARPRDAFYSENARGAEARYDFSYANLQPDSFPVKTWRRLVNDVLYANTAPEFARYGRTDRPNSLSEALVRLLGQTRGVDCLAQQVLPQAGTGGAMGTLLQLFDRKCDAIGLEEPGYATVREVSQRLGFRLVSLPSDQGPEAFLDALYEHSPKIAFVTPSHQFPTGRVLHLDARMKLLQWAQDNDSYIVEDDSCNEYRYGTSPIPSLQSLDAHDRVVYLCNVSKVLSPSMRLAYLVLPPKLLDRYYHLFRHAHPPVPLLEQEVLARFMDEGYWAQHVRRTASGNRRRHDILVQCLEEQMGEHIDIEGMHAGMHLWATVRNNMTQGQLLTSAIEQGAAVYGTKRFWFSKPAPENHVMLGFSAIADKDIPAGVAALARAWFPRS